MSEFELRTVRAPIEDFTDREALESLYERAFPQNERRPMAELLNEKSGMVEVLAFYYQGSFCGMAATLTSSGLVHIIYLAIEEAARGKGLGSMALEAIRKRDPGKKIIVDVERVEDGATNNDQRAKRIAFYRKNGYRETEVRYRWREEDYVILSCGGVMTEREWDEFWKEVWDRTGVIR